MSQHMERMALGETIDVKGPLGHFIYDGCGAFRNSGKKGFAKKMSMIAGGTGITPMFQIIKVSLVQLAPQRLTICARRGETGRACQAFRLNVSWGLQLATTICTIETGSSA